MNEEDIRAQLEAEYDRVIKETLQKLYRSKPLNRAKITAALMAANKAYWTARLALLDNDAVYAAGRVSGALAMSYYYAAEDLAEQVQHVYAGYRSAFHLSQKGAKELLDKVVYDRPIAESLQRIADAMPAGEEKTRILAEISAPAYRYRMQRAEQIAKNAQEACENIARGEIAIDRQFLQTEIEKAYNISLDGALSEPPSGEIADMLSGDVVLDRPVPAQPLEMPRADEPVQDFTPTDDRGIMDSFSVVSTDHAREIMENRWSGESFSERIWSNTDDLAQEVKQVILEGELTGASEAKMAAKIRDRFTVGMHEARRVVRTEHNYCINQAELKGMKDAGFDEYEFASLGENADGVCHTCDDLDGERFKIEDAVVGVNCPPMHPFCRCKATTPMETEEDVQADIDRMLDGRSIEDIERELDAKIEQENQRKLLPFAQNSGRSDVTSEYIDNATPGVGSISHDAECTADQKAVEKYQDELNFAEWVHKTLGGDIHVNAEDDKTTGIKFPDYLWRGKLWDLKSPSNEEAANGLVRKGMKQILKNPGGVMLNFGEHDVSLTLLEKVLDERMQWYKNRSVDIIVVSKDELIKVYRYKK